MSNGAPPAQYPDAAPAEGFAKDPELADFNERFAVIMLGGKARVMGWENSTINPGTKVPFYMTFDDFRNFMGKYRKIVVHRDKDGSLQEKRVPMGQWWLDHPQRRQFKGVSYIPYSDDEAIDGVLNLWTGFAVAAIKGDKHLSLLEHIRQNICNGHEDYYNYLVGWMADRVQNRHKPAGVAVVLKSEGRRHRQIVFREVVWLSVRKALQAHNQRGPPCPQIQQPPSGLPGTIRRRGVLCQ